MPLPVSAGVQPYLLDLENNMLNGLAVARLCEGLKRDGFTPDIVIGHTGWGELLFVKDVWPQRAAARLFRVLLPGRATPTSISTANSRPNAEDAMRVRMRNASNLLSLDAADWGHTPTKFQRDAIRPSTIGPHQRDPRGGRHRPRAARPHGAVVAARRADAVARRPGADLQRPQPRTLSRVPQLHAGAAGGAGTLPECPGHHHRRRRRQLRQAAGTGRQLARMHAGRVRRPARSASACILSAGCLTSSTSRCCRSRRRMSI